MARRKRDSDTAALVGSPICEGELHEVRTEKIDNGYLVHRTSYGGDAGYRRSTVYSAKAPRVDLERSPRGDTGARPGEASRYLREGK